MAKNGRISIIGSVITPAGTEVELAPNYPS
jgi:hypothetical protein